MNSSDSSTRRTPVARIFRLTLDVLLGVIVGVVLTMIATDLLLFAQAKSAFTTVNGGY